MIIIRMIKRLFWRITHWEWGVIVKRKTRTELERMNKQSLQMYGTSIGVLFKVYPDETKAQMIDKLLGAE